MRKLQSGSRGTVLVSSLVPASSMLFTFKTVNILKDSWDQNVKSPEYHTFLLIAVLSIWGYRIIFEFFPLVFFSEKLNVRSLLWKLRDSMAFTFERSHKLIISSAFLQVDKKGCCCLCDLVVRNYMQNETLWNQPPEYPFNAIPNTFVFF